MKPGHLDLPTVWRGCSYPIFSLKWLGFDGRPLNLAGWTPFARSVNIDFHPEVANAAQGLTTIYLTSGETSNFKLGVEEWDWIWVHYSGYTTPPLLAGTVPIKQATTKRGAPGPPPPPPPPPVNDNFGNNLLMSGLVGELAGTTVAATRQTGEPPGENSVWYRWRPNQVVLANMHLGNAVGKISIYTGDAVGSLHHVTTSVVAGGRSALSFVTAINTFYRVRVYKNTGTAPFTLNWNWSI